jgi:hypothetical protein
MSEYIQQKMLGLINFLGSIKFTIHACMFTPSVIAKCLIPSPVDFDVTEFYVLKNYRSLLIQYKLTSA